MYVAEVLKDPRTPKELDEVRRIYAYQGGRLLPLREAKVSVMTHAFLYGTAVFGWRSKALNVIA